MPPLVTPRRGDTVLPVSRIVDPEQIQLTAVLRSADFRGRRVLEIGCGDGRLTFGIARYASSVVAFDPDEQVVELARRRCPADLRESVAFAVASAEEIEVEPQSVDLLFFSWSL